ncbi:MAG: hypothetical protein Q4P14_00940 [Methanobacteriaceae archaeon]|nr:hypothetical protein [Methanobacteriaceae archaeon]
MSKLIVDPEKVDNLGFGDEEWGEVCKILDDPNVSQEKKKEVKEKYFDNLIKAITTEVDD